MKGQIGGKMKLYISPAACSLSPHIVAQELRLDIRIVEVDRSAAVTSDGQDFLAINPHGYVPVLELDDGEILMEGPAIVQHLAAMKPEAGLAPIGARERRQVQQMLNFVSTEIHKPMAQMFNPEYALVKNVLRTHVIARLGWLSSQLADDYLIGERLSVADFYLFVCLNWSQWLEIDLSPWPRLGAFMIRIGERPAVRAALEAEGLAHHDRGVFFAPRASA